MLSHRSAAAFWAIRLGELFRVEVTTGDDRRQRAIATHRGEARGADRTIHRGIPVASPARTLVDLAHVLDHDELTERSKEAMFRRLYDPRRSRTRSRAARRRR